MISSSRSSRRARHASMMRADQRTGNRSADPRGLSECGEVLLVTGTLPRQPDQRRMRAQGQDARGGQPRGRRLTNGRPVRRPQPLRDWRPRKADEGAPRQGRGRYCHGPQAGPHPLRDDRHADALPGRRSPQTARQSEGQPSQEHEKTGRRARFRKLRFRRFRAELLGRGDTHPEVLCLYRWQVSIVSLGRARIDLFHLVWRRECFQLNKSPARQSNQFVVRLYPISLSSS